MQMKLSWQKISIILMINILLAVMLVPVFFLADSGQDQRAFFDAGCTVIYGTDDFNSIGEIWPGSCWI